MPYTELHLHSCFSFLEGASTTLELASTAAALGYTALALTDHDGLHGAMEFAQSCASVGVRPITGVELTLRHGFVWRESGPVHLTLLAETAEGYANLCQLVTEAHRSNPRDAVALDPAFLAGRTAGVIALTGCREGEVARLVDAGRLAEAAAAASWLAGLFGADSTFIELQHNLVRGDTARCRELAALAERVGLPLAATGNVHYHLRERHRLQDALVALKHHATLESSHTVRRPNSEFYLRSPQQAAAAFAGYPQAVVNTQRIADRCAAFDLSRRDALGYEFPDFSRGEGETAATADEVLAEYCWSRFGTRYPEVGTDPELLAKAKSQLDEELRLVAKHHLAGFFLIYRDLQSLATRVAAEVRGPETARGASGLPPGRGRGSAVSSILCYLIGLSHVDPVKNKLFLHRFLNEDLQAVPDIDLDFARDIREHLILKVLEEYGHDHAALVCSFATYHLRSAVRDLGKVLGLPEAALDKLAKLSEGGGADTVRRELQMLPEFQGQANGPLWEHLATLAEQINGMPRHVSQHVGGMIISSRPLIELVPVQPAAWAGRFICQWDKDSCDDARFIKIDFLALGMLSLVEECLELIWHNRSEKLDLSTIDYDDTAVYDTITHGDTVGIFQIESRAQIQMLPRTQPRNLDDLAVQVAIVRPGPIVGGAVNPYVRRREVLRNNPRATIHADHPMLDDLLADTLGVVLYQDQVLEVAIHMGGFTPGQADQFRRSMSRKRSAEAMAQFRDLFVQGAEVRGVTSEDAQEIFTKLQAFSAFGFPKSHAYAFAVLAYQSAWLRYHYPAEYFAALFNNQPMGFYAPHVLVGDAKRHQVPVLPVAVNTSTDRCSVDGGQVLLGLTTVRGLGEDLAQHMVAERRANGPFRTLGDFVRRTGCPFEVVSNLIAVGAMSEFGLSRRELLWQLGLLLPQADPTGRARTVRSLPGWGTRKPRTTNRQLAFDLPTEPDMVHLQDMNAWERMVADYKILGLSPSSHPLDLLRRQLPRRILPVEALWQQPEGKQVQTAGMVVCRQRPGTAKGFVFLLVEDETGLANVVVQPDLYDAKRSIVRGEAYVLVTGRIQLRSGTLNVLAEDIAPLSAAYAQGSPRVPLRYPYPGNPNDPREQPALPVEGREQGAQPPSPAALRALATATPPSHNFH